MSSVQSDVTSVAEQSVTSVKCPQVPAKDDHITKVLSVIRRVAPKSRFSEKASIKFNSKLRDARLSNFVPDCFRTLWDNGNVLEPDEKPVTRVELPRVSVDWTRVNRRFLSNIPTPIKYPVHGCSSDPEFYNTIEERKYFGLNSFQSTFHKCKFEKEQYPFGYAYGIYTDIGVIDVSDVIVHGHKWSPDEERWLLHAEMETGTERDKEMNMKTTMRTRMMNMKTKMMKTQHYSTKLIPT